jgi:hypothetical protein
MVCGTVAIAHSMMITLGRERWGMKKGSNPIKA